MKNGKPWAIVSGENNTCCDEGNAALPMSSCEKCSHCDSVINEILLNVMDLHCTGCYYITKKKYMGGNSMRSTGIVRRVDELGRVVMPVELRRTLGIREGDPIEIFVDGDKIVLKKYERSCIFCGDATEMAQFRGKAICVNCIKEMDVFV